MVKTSATPACTSSSLLRAGLHSSRSSCQLTCSPVSSLRSLFSVAYLTLDTSWSATSLGWDNATFGRRHGILILMLMGLLCVVREAFTAATADNLRHVRSLSYVTSTCVADGVVFPQANKPALFYPLVATTEFICALLFLVPGLVPTRKELQEGGVRDEKGKHIRTPESSGN